jgi:hypothetical protein
VRGDVDDVVVSDWLTILPSICDGYNTDIVLQSYVKKYMSFWYNAVS